MIFRLLTPPCSAQENSLHVLNLEPFLLRNERYLEHSGLNFHQHVSSLQQEYAH